MPKPTPSVALPSIRHPDASSRPAPSRAHVPLLTTKAWRALLAVEACVALAACSSSVAGTTSGGGGSTSTSTGGVGDTSTTTGSAGNTTTATSSSGGASNACTLTDDTTPTSTVNGVGCHVESRDTGACQASRTAAGLSGYWLKLSCRITLAVTTDGGARVVQATSDSQPDHLSNYFPATSPCHEAYPGVIQEPALIAPATQVVTFPLAPTTTAESMKGTAVVGLALDGVPIFGNFAAPGDDIFQEAMTFDRCGGHPNNTSYHYHCEPYAITYDDDGFVGVMRDGYPIYGRKDSDGSYPAVDTYGGHTGVTVDSPTTPVYHYHVNQQTSTSANTYGEKQWFLTTGTFRGTPGTCASCK